MSNYYDKDGSRLTLMEWAHKFEDVEYKRVAQDILEDGTRISTVWLGLNHSYRDTDAPLIFETMVFTGERFRWGDRFDKQGEDTELGRSFNKVWENQKDTEFSEELDQRRYSTEQEAIDGHQEMVNRWSAKTPEERSLRAVLDSDTP